MSHRYNSYMDDASFVVLGLLVLLANQLATSVVTVDAWTATTAPIIQRHEWRPLAVAAIRPLALASGTRLEAKGKNKRRNREKNAEAGGDDDGDGKRRADGKRMGRRRKSIDPHSSSASIKKKPKRKTHGRRGTGDADPAKTTDPKHQGVTIDQLQTKRCWLRLETKRSPFLEPGSPLTQAHLPLDICLVEVQDKTWWKIQEEEYQSKAIENDGQTEDEKKKKKKENNPYGTRVWPASLALAEFLSDYLRSMATIDSMDSDSTITNEQRTACSAYHVLEIGSGTGLISMAAALCGAKVMATDVAPVTLRLLQQGWTETCDKQRKHREKLLSKHQFTLEEGEDFKVMDGNLKMGLLDVTSSDPLPWPEIAKGQDSSRGQTRVLVASAVLYEESLARDIARCCFQACYQDGAWVILADDDTGLREGGRDAFEKEWALLVANDSRKKKKKKSPWVRATVEQKTVFGWANKQVQLLHLNFPSSLQFD